MERIAALYETNFGILDDEPPKFKGTMELAGEAVAEEAGRRMGV
jgi:hypothetical protein